MPRNDRKEDIEKLDGDKLLNIHITNAAIEIINKINEIIEVINEQRRNR